MNLQQFVFVVGLVAVLLAAATSGEAEFEKYVPKHLFKRQTLKCEDCKSNAVLTTVVTVLGNIASVVFKLLSVLEDLTKEFDVTQATVRDLKLLLEALISRIPAVLNEAKESVKSLVPCPQLDELFVSASTTLQGIATLVISELPLLTIAKVGNKVAEFVSNLSKAITILVNKVFQEKAAISLFGLLGLCGALDRLLPKLLETVNPLASLLATLISAGITGKLPETITELVKGVSTDISKILLQGLSSLVAGLPVDALVKQLTQGGTGVLADFLASLINFLLEVIKESLAKGPVLPDLGNVVPAGASEGLAALLGSVVGLVVGLVKGLLGALKLG